MFVQVICWAAAAFLIIGIIGAAVGGGKKQNASVRVSVGTTVAPSTVPATTTTTPPTTTPPTTTPPTTAPPTTAPPATPSLTPSQQNAIRSAQQYLNFKGFSRLGLIHQLSSPAGDGYPLADATFAVDSLRVDWNAQAAISAKDYLSFMPFSCSGLIQQLSSSAGDQFTLAQAQYGAKAAGIC